MNKKEISVSILDCDFDKLNNEINQINNTDCDYIHIDVMDGSFVSSSAFDFKTIEKVNYYLNKGDQVLFFLNRRGYSPYVICKKCGYKFQCPNCSISLNFHKFKLKS